MPSDKHIPSGFPALVPYLTVDDPAELVGFLRQAFGAEEMKEQRWEHPAGKILHTAMRVGGCVVEIGRASAEWKAMPVALHLYVPDVDATFERALKAGGVDIGQGEYRGVKDMEYDERACAVRDPCGNHWYIATHTRRT